MSITHIGQECNCHNNALPVTEKKMVTGAQKTSGTMFSVLLSVLIAFFPKCPFCWAAYMSMFGSVGLARLPYMPWLLPVLMAMLGVHVLVLFKKAAGKSYMPFAVSVAGAITIIIARLYFPSEKYLLIAGMLAIAAGSLLANFNTGRTASPVYKSR